MSMHKSKFKDFLANCNIVNEDVKMQLFVMSLDLLNNKDLANWHNQLPTKGISSFKQLVKTFSEKWDPNLEENVRTRMANTPS